MMTATKRESFALFITPGKLSPLNTSKESFSLKKAILNYLKHSVQSLYKLILIINPCGINYISGNNCYYFVLTFFHASKIINYNHIRL